MPQSLTRLRAAFRHRKHYRRLCHSFESQAVNFLRYGNFQYSAKFTAAELDKSLAGLSIKDDDCSIAQRLVKFCALNKIPATGVLTWTQGIP